MNAIYNLIAYVLLDLAPKPPPADPISYYIVLAVVLSMTTALVTVPFAILYRIWKNKEQKRTKSTMANAALTLFIIMGIADAVFGAATLFANLISKDTIQNLLASLGYPETAYYPGLTQFSIFFLQFIAACFLLGGMALALGSSYVLYVKLKR